MPSYKVAAKHVSVISIMFVVNVFAFIVRFKYRYYTNSWMSFDVFVIHNWPIY